MLLSVTAENEVEDSDKNYIADKSEQICSAEGVFYQKCDDDESEYECEH